MDYKEILEARNAELRKELIAYMGKHCLTPQQTAERADLCLMTVYRFIRGQRVCAPGTLRKVRNLLKNETIAQQDN